VTYPPVQRVTKLLALTVLLCTPAMARESDTLSPEAARAVMHDYAKCVVDQQPRRASNAIVANFSTAKLLTDYPMLFSPDCLAQFGRGTGAMSFAGDLYRYALAGALFDRELAERPVPDLSAVPPLEHMEAPTAPEAISASEKKLSTKKRQDAQKKYEVQIVSAFLSRYGECLVRTDPVGSKALLLSKPDSDEERARFTALDPALATCLPEGRTFDFGKIPLRGSIALNYYRLAQAGTDRRAAR